jgi:hypothetical protein
MKPLRMISSRRSHGTSMGMRRWWAKQPWCLGCKKKKIRNVMASRLCASCRRKSEKLKREWRSHGKTTILIVQESKAHKSYRVRTDKSLDGELYRLSERHISGYQFEFSVRRYGEDDVISLMMDDFEILQVGGVKI